MTADSRFFLTPRRGTVMLYDDQPDEKVGGIYMASNIGCHHLDFLVVAVNPEDTLDFGVGSVVILDDPNIFGDVNHRRMLDGVVYRSVPLEHIIGVKE